MILSEGSFPAVVKSAVKCVISAISCWVETSAGGDGGYQAMVATSICGLVCGLITRTPSSIFLFISTADCLILSVLAHAHCDCAYYNFGHYIAGFFQATFNPPLKYVC